MTIARFIPQSHPELNTQPSSQDVSQDIGEDITQDISRNITRDIAQNVSQEVTQNITGVARSSASPIVSEAIRIRGTVQGVGFRPLVYRLARACHLRGEVCNDGTGVLIQVTGQQADLDEFVDRIQRECPILARIESIDRVALAEPLTHQDFTITRSLSSTIQTTITPDAAICPECTAEIFDPLNRRYRYPFTNCTHCGPRLSIVRSIPYDRAQTSMSAFPMCPDCCREYEEVSDRRFHAQPIACHRCGPKAWLERADGKPITASMFSMLDDVDAVCTLIQKGEIVAIKGIGGFHLACDATNEAAVQKLRQRKQRYHKPFALMARDISIIEQYCNITAMDRDLLESAIAPIVLMPKRDRNITPSIAPSVAPDQTTLGFMLPYTPLHHLILKRMNRPIVLTSGNRSDEPQCIDNQEAREKLRDIADYFLLHDRDIVNRVDDSIVRVIDNQVQVLRRARGYAPAPIRLPAGFESAPPILAMGSELKNTMGLLRDGQAILSQHLGDLENAVAFSAYQQTLDLYLKLFEHQPGAIAVDYHPNYLSTQFGKELAIANALPLQQVQHHHAHIAACMAENNLPLDSAPVLGIALDGVGYGEADKLWGGEFLLADYREFTRLGHLKPVAMLGGEQAIYHPWRNTYAHLKAAFDWQMITQQYGNLEVIQFLQQHPLVLFDQLLAQEMNAPLVSSCGRLFDAVAAALDICREASYEGQGAIALESLAESAIGQETIGYPFAIENHILEPRPMWQALLNDLQQGVAKAKIAARFQVGLGGAIAQMVNLLRDDHEFTQVALTGGVFQNRLLHQTVQQTLSQSGFIVLTHRFVPPNDGGITLGQLAISAARCIDGST
ncbi:MAG: carbamoyltransferase HypF [Oculatellaceae cyanobacterium Prado106]|nr:carbamoyltransferase HypF [Oculatellaceae cyanobacterium Prado106]